MADVTHLLAIDPGPEQSAWVELRDDSTRFPGVFDICDNTAIAEMLRAHEPLRDYHHLAIEMVASYGMPVGKSIFETCLWVGRFIEAWGAPHTKVYRKDVKHYICFNSHATDASIRQALIDRYPPTGGGKTPQIGVKAKPGPLYGFKKDLWAALAVGHTWLDMRAERGADES